jgi:DnaK suppressor protein
LNPRATRDIGHEWELDMEPADLERAKTILLELLQEAARPLRRLEEIAVDNPPDTIDRVQNAVERELAIRQIESGFNRLQSIKLALERIEEGTYGTCAGCESEIGNKRLIAVPWASQCLRCQDIADREYREPEGQELLRSF